MSQKNMSQKNMSQIIVYKNQEELLTDIEKMTEEVEDIEKLLKIKQNEYNELSYNLYVDSARSVTAGVRKGMPGSYDISEEAKKYLSKLSNDIKKMINKAVAIRVNIDEKEKVLRNVKNAAKSDTARGKSPISNKTSISNPIVIIKNEMSPDDVKYILINKNLDKRSVASLKAINDHKQSVNTLYDAFVAAKASSSATRSESSSSPRALSPAARRASSSVSRALSPAARRALSPAARRASSSASIASSPSSKTCGLRKRRGKKSR